MQPFHYQKFMNVVSAWTVPPWGLTSCYISLDVVICEYLDLDLYQSSIEAFFMLSAKNPFNAFTSLTGTYVVHNESRTSLTGTCPIYVIHNESRRSLTKACLSALGAPPSNLRTSFFAPSLRCIKNVPSSCSYRSSDCIFFPLGTCTTPNDPSCLQLLSIQWPAEFQASLMMVEQITNILCFQLLIWLTLLRGCWDSSIPAKICWHWKS